MKNISSETSLNSFRPGDIWPDNNGVHINAHGGGILLHEGVYYWFGEHKIEGEAGNAAHVGVHVYASRDLYNWTDAGIALAVSPDPDSVITAGSVIERPKVIHCRHTGKFVMWFHLELKNVHDYAAARCGVAVSDTVTGPYRFIESFRPNAGVWPQNVPEGDKRPLTAEEVAQFAKLSFTGGWFPEYPTDKVFRRDFAGGQMSRDMTLFVDDDGAAYHIHSSEDNGTLHISQLTDDYLKPRGRYSRAFPGRFHEGQAIFKQGGRYYLISSGCTGWAPNAARLAVAHSIWGPWTEIGAPCEGDVNRVATTFDSQSTYILPVAGKPGAFIFMADRWRPQNAIDGRYVWLPIQFAYDRPYIAWLDQWDLEFFG